MEIESSLRSSELRDEDPDDLMEEGSSVEINTAGQGKNEFSRKPATVFSSHHTGLGHEVPATKVQGNAS